MYMNKYGIKQIEEVFLPCRTDVLLLYCLTASKGVPVLVWPIG